MTNAKCSKRKETPIAVMRAEMRGAFRTGRYAPRSMTIPKRAVKRMATRKEAYQGREKIKMA
jgi:hypothetical protein